MSERRGSRLAGVLSRQGLVCVVLGLLVVGLQVRELRLVSSIPASVKLRTGDPAPPLRFQTPDGRQEDLASLRGSPVLVTFWASWCVPCRAELPELARAVKEMNTEAAPPVRVLAINTSDDTGDAQQVMSDPAYADFTFGLDGDGSIAKAWGASALPTMVLVRPDGKVDESRVGYDPYLGSRLRAWVRGVRPKDAR
jgi:thiol-disulfide isomerase/thioredoxin